MKSLRQPITQDQSYHQFADTRVWLGTPNAADVYSSLLFVVVGLASAVWLSRRNVAQRWIWLTFFGSVTLVGFGSACYHLNPCDATLFWDRLPMAVAFTSFLAGLLGERAGAALFLPLVVFGVTSVVYWRHTDDLRLYALVQYGPMVAVPLMLWAVPRLRAQAVDV
ncbi:MAG: ceramidase, partial [Verrucomicrobiae bacterium]|nr:ceramidase [Verrucomicrobiae bacterium]